MWGARNSPPAWARRGLAPALQDSSNGACSLKRSLIRLAFGQPPSSKGEGFRAAQCVRPCSYFRGDFDMLDHLRTLREDRDLSQADLARVLHIHQTSYPPDHLFRLRTGKSEYPHSGLKGAGPLL